MTANQPAGVRYLKRPAVVAGDDLAAIEARVRAIIDDVRRNGDEALRRYSLEFDGYDGALEVETAERQQIVDSLDPGIREDLDYAIANVTRFAEAQRATLQPLEIETLPGVHLGHRVIPIDRVGVYVPGGRYPILSAAVMTVVPARVAGCKEIIACLPPKAHPAMIAGCIIAGAHRIFRVGGAQAIAAMAYGTASVPEVDKIFGPGNAYVNEAKRQVFGRVGIDQLAGPSEIFTVADDSGDAAMIAADLLAQAEHDVRSRVGLITTSEALGQAVLAEIERQLQTLRTREVAGAAWRDHGEIAVCDGEAAMIAYSDFIAAEHLQVHTRDSAATARKLTHYGSLFIGPLASVVYSDKCCGTNPTLPTMAGARHSGGLWVGSYLKVCTHQWLEPQGVAQVAPHAVRQAGNEGQWGHQAAAEYRLRLLGINHRLP
ncbi:MAG: histidinol dehydrogenase [Aestuariivirga sp.]|uniref:histidinol dehydrogenase n=1 Tax=Aestuariivirga sp. TaxID=2650926 RepID=UPI0038CF3A1D